MPLRSGIHLCPKKGRPRILMKENERTYVGKSWQFARIWFRSLLRLHGTEVAQVSRNELTPGSFGPSRIHIQPSVSQGVDWRTLCSGTHVRPSCGRRRNERKTRKKVFFLSSGAQYRGVRKEHAQADVKFGIIIFLCVCATRPVLSLVHDVGIFGRLIFP